MMSESRPPLHARVNTYLISTGIGRFALRSRRRQVLTGLATLLFLLLCVPGVSYAQALSAPGYAGWQVRTVEWLREHGGSSMINAAENWWYTENAPPHSATSSLSARRGTAPPAVSSPTSHVDQPRPLPLLPGGATVQGEGGWQADPRQVDGQPVLYTTIFRPDPVYTSSVAAVAWMPRSVLSGSLIPGTRLPGPPGLSSTHSIAASMRPSAVAAFNSGYKLADSNGGYFQEGVTAKPLVPGAASLVFHSDGTMTVGAWGRDATLTPDVVAVRQNLRLIVDNGAVVPGLAHNPGNAWGAPGQQNQFTWRSGIGVDSNGNLVYVAAQQFNLPMLAYAMASAGIVRGMQLDIHKHQVTFNIFRQTAPGAQTLTASKLMPEMTEPATRYLQADQRDFIAIEMRPSSL